MTVRWFQLDDFYKDVGGQDIFYPHHYARGYRLSAEQRVAMDDVLGPFLRGRLLYEFIAIFSSITFLLTIGAASFLFTASTQQLDAILATPPWIWIVGAFALACAILFPVLFRLQSKIRRQIELIGVEASEPPQPDFFIVNGAFSLKRLLAVIAVLCVILILVANIT
jgi:hypothetical protein